MIERKVNNGENRKSFQVPIHTNHASLCNLLQLYIQKKKYILDYLQIYSKLG